MLLEGGGVCATVGAEATVCGVVVVVVVGGIVGYRTGILRTFNERLLRRTTSLRGVGLPLRMVCCDLFRVLFRLFKCAGLLL
jgi:hypothetical protein